LVSLFLGSFVAFPKFKFNHNLFHFVQSKTGFQGPSPDTPKPGR
jgi:hypothetical protein